MSLQDQSKITTESPFRDVVFLISGPIILPTYEKKYVLSNLWDDFQSLKKVRSHPNNIVKRRPSLPIIFHFNKTPNIPWAWLISEPRFCRFWSQSSSNYRFVKKSSWFFFYSDPNLNCLFLFEECLKSIFDISKLNEFAFLSNFCFFKLGKIEIGKKWRLKDCLDFGHCTNIALLLVLLGSPQ